MEDGGVLSPGSNGPGDFGHGLSTWFPGVKSRRGPLGWAPLRRPDSTKVSDSRLHAPEKTALDCPHSISTPDSVLAVHRAPSRNQESESFPAINTCRPHQSCSLKKENATQRMGADATTSSSTHGHSINKWKWSSHGLKSNYFCFIKTKGIQMANSSYSGGTGIKSRRQNSYTHSHHLGPS